MAVRVTLANPDFPVDRQSQELWRAATSDKDAALQKRIGDSLFLKASDLARTHAGDTSAVDIYSDLVDRSSASSVYTEIGKRALLRAIHSNGGASAFAAELFAETASYYVSRDLPSLIGHRSRIASVTEGISLKQSVTNLARQAATTVASASETFGRQKSVTAAEWRSYVASVLTVLKGES